MPHALATKQKHSAFHIGQSQIENHPLLKAFRNLKHGQLSVIVPDGRWLMLGDADPALKARMKINDEGVLDETVTNGQIGFAETYMRGEWDTDDLPSLLTLMLLNDEYLEQFFYGKPLQVLAMRLRHMLNKNTLSGSTQNIQAHYDLGNEFYSKWLDESMTYSCALFEGSTSRTLEEAQQAKYERILDKLQAKPGETILEIGCGWGGFAEIAARRGIHVHGITISAEQLEYARDRIQRQNLDHLVTLELRDYRELDDTYDYVVSIGMFEHVGSDYWPTYFETIKKHLKPTGKAMIQSIFTSEKVFKGTQGKYGFMEKYIFPGGELPTPDRFRDAAKDAGLERTEMFTFGPDYARTLRHWLDRFERQLPEIKAMGYDDTFIRMWRFYLSACIAAFTIGRNSVMQAELRHASAPA